MKPTRLATFVALLCCCGWLAAPAAARQQQAEQPTVTVTGQAEISVPPDEVLFRLEVEKTDKDLDVAKRMNDESVARLLELARKFQVPARDVKTDYISVDMKYTTDLAEDLEEADRRRVRREFVGYEVSKTVIIRFTDIPRFEQLFAEVLKAGVSRVTAAEFRTSEVRKYRDQARAQAIRAAREKAEALAREIGQTIGKAVSIREGSYQDPRASANFAGVVSSRLSDEEYATIAPGLIKINAVVTVSFVLN